MDLFGKSGQKLVPLLSPGAKGIDELRAEGNRLGLTVGTEDAQAAEAFGDALSSLWKSLTQVAFMVGAALAPTLKQIAEWITRVAAIPLFWVTTHELVRSSCVCGIASLHL